jgi:hypothetical protein
LGTILAPLADTLRAPEDVNGALVDRTLDLVEGRVYRNLVGGLGFVNGALADRPLDLVDGRVHRKPGWGFRV